MRHYLQTMGTFPDRLKQAALYRRVEFSPTVLGRALGLSKQTVHRWMKGSSIPTPENIFLIADTWRVNARWLATGEDTMLSLPVEDSLNKHETEIIAAYRSAQIDGKNSLRTLARAIGRGLVGLFLVASISQPDPAQAAFSQKCAHAVYYVKSLIRRIKLYFAVSNHGI